MDVLKNKNYAKFDYINRYSHIPYYFDTRADREVFGIGEQLDRTTAYVTHKVNQTDTLDSIALTYYNNPTFWWVIAAFNNIIDALEPIQDKYKVLKIPVISGIRFRNERT